MTFQNSRNFSDFFYLNISSMFYKSGKKSHSLFSLLYVPKIHVAPFLSLTLQKCLRLKDKIGTLKELGQEAHVQGEVSKLFIIVHCNMNEQHF
jgi:hypothetical protein